MPEPTVDSMLAAVEAVPEVTPDVSTPTAETPEGDDGVGIAAVGLGETAPEPVVEASSTVALMPGDDEYVAPEAEPISEVAAHSELTDILKDTDYVAELGGADKVRAIFDTILPQIKQYGGWDAAVAAIQADNAKAEAARVAATEAQEKQKQEQLEKGFQSHVDRVTDATAKRQAESQLTADNYSRDDNPEGWDAAVTRIVDATKAQTRGLVEQAEAQKFHTRMGAAKEMAVKYPHANMDVVNEIASNLTVDPNLINYYAAITNADTVSKIAPYEQKYSEAVRERDEIKASIPKLVAEAEARGRATAGADLEAKRKATNMDAPGERSVKDSARNGHQSMNDIDRMLVASGNA